MYSDYIKKLENLYNLGLLEGEELDQYTRYLKEKKIFETKNRIYFL